MAFLENLESYGVTSLRSVKWLLLIGRQSHLIDKLSHHRCLNPDSVGLPAQHNLATESQKSRFGQT